MFFPFLQVLIPTEWSFSMKAITENQLHDFLINSRYSCKKCCLHNSTLLGTTVTVDPRMLRKGDCFCHFPEFFFGDHEFFSQELG